MRLQRDEILSSLNQAASTGFGKGLVHSKHRVHHGDDGPHRPQHERLIQVEDPSIVYRVTRRAPSLSRNAIRKYLRSDIVAPKFNVPDRPSKLDGVADQLARCLKG